MKLEDGIRLARKPEGGAGRIGEWIDDYNNKHSQSGIKMRSPREFIRAYR